VALFFFIACPGDVICQVQLDGPLKSLLQGLFPAPGFLHVPLGLELLIYPVFPVFGKGEVAQVIGYLCLNVHGLYRWLIAGQGVLQAGTTNIVALVAGTAALAAHLAAALAAEKETGQGIDEGDRVAALAGARAVEMADFQAAVKEGLFDDCRVLAGIQGHR